MKIIEVRDGFIKLEAIEDLSLSGFLLVSSEEKKYIAQIVRLKKTGEYTIAYAKLLYLYDGELRNYDKSLLLKDATITKIGLEFLSQNLLPDNQVVLGGFVEGNQQIVADRSCLNKNLLISVDSIDTNRTILANISKQLDNYVVLDTLGVVQSQKYVAGVDFKLPLNTKTLEFMLEDCLNDATSDSKALVKEIFADLSEYSKTVPFLPFTALKSIVDEMVDKQHVFKLLVLKNKLVKFERQGYFAKDKSETEILLNILSNKNVVIDLSRLEPVFQNRFVELILYTLKINSIQTQLFVEASNALSKKTLKILIAGEFSTTLITHSKFKFLNDIKSMFANYIIEPTFNNNQLFGTYSTFLTSMPKESYLVVGEATRFLPLVSLVKDYELESKQYVVENDDEIFEEVVVQEDAQNEEVSSIFEIKEEQEPSIIAIEKKSEDFIEKVAEEIQEEQNVPEIQLFDANESDEDNNESLSSMSSSQILSIENVIEEQVIEQIENYDKQSSEESFQNIDLSSIEEIPNEQVLDEDASSIDLVEELAEDTVEEIVEIQEADLEEISSEDSLKEAQDEVILTESETVSEFQEFHTSVDDTKIEEIIELDEFSTKEEDIQTIEVSEEISMMAEEAENLELVETQSEIIEDNDSLDIEILPISSDSTEEIVEAIDLEQDKLVELQEVNEVQEQEITIAEDLALDVIPIVEDDDIAFEEIVELDDAEISDDVVVIDIDESADSLEKEIVEDVDMVYTTMKDDSISDSDLDFIDELNDSSDDEELNIAQDFEEVVELEEGEENDFLEPLEEISDSENNIESEEKDVLETRNASTPIVPVYDAEIPAEDLVSSDPLEQGDTVVHAKYGNGVVEKMIKYGSKTLFSINFDNVGRRLLDPTLTEIKKC